MEHIQHMQQLCSTPLSRSPQCREVWGSEVCLRFCRGFFVCFSLCVVWRWLQCFRIWSRLKYTCPGFIWKYLSTEITEWFRCSRFFPGCEFWLVGVVPWASGVFLKESNRTLLTVLHYCVVPGRCSTIAAMLKFLLNQELILKLNVYSSCKSLLRTASFQVLGQFIFGLTIFNIYSMD